MTSIDLGPAYVDGPEGVDRSLLAHVLGLASVSPGDGIAVEFGVGSGETLRMICAAGFRCLGFDAFKGLPEDWRPGFPKGKFRQEQPTTFPAGVTIVEGWFADTVTPYDFPDNVALWHIDCDLYASTVTVLDAIGPHLNVGAYIVMDEFHGFDDDLHGNGVPGEQRAWVEFIDRTGVTYEPIGHGREQYAVRITGGAR